MVSYTKKYEEHISCLRLTFKSTSSENLSKGDYQCILFQEVGPTPVKDPILKKYNLMIENSEQSKSVERGWF